MGKQSVVTMYHLGNSSNEMDYLNTLIQKWMPGQQRVAVDSKPKLHGIFDTINSTLAAGGTETRLPPEFYDKKAREIIDRIVVEEEYSGYKESIEYRTVGIGALLSEVMQRMARNGQVSRTGGSCSGKGHLRDTEDEESNQKLALFSGHDSTLAAILASLGAMNGENGTWPSYTSSLAIELFRDHRPAGVGNPPQTDEAGMLTQSPKKEQGLFPNVLNNGSRLRSLSNPRTGHIDDTAGLYVRIRYNDRPILVPGCRGPERHLEGEQHFCTLVRAQASEKL